MSLSASRWPRRSLADGELMPEQYEGRRLSHPMDAEMRIVRSQIGSAEHPRWRQVTGQVERTIPARLRAVSLAVVDMESSYYVKRLSAENTPHSTPARTKHARLLKDIGFARALVVGKDFVDDYYLDRIHLTVTGGHKLAAELAPIIRGMAVELGYLK